MRQIELFPLSEYDKDSLTNKYFALHKMLEQVSEAYNRYTETAGGNAQYADHVLFDDSDAPMFTVVKEFWPEMCTDYMEQAHPTMWDAIVERD
jgi:hypothetical protein